MAFPEGNMEFAIVRITVLASESAHLKCGSKRGQSQLSNQHAFCPAAFINIVYMIHSL